MSRLLLFYKVFYLLPQLPSKISIEFACPYLLYYFSIKSSYDTLAYRSWVLRVI